jgi:prepilin signal peptidase PulO-like enzyme (type II secretory pathway)
MPRYLILLTGIVGLGIGRYLTAYLQEKKQIDLPVFLKISTIIFHALLYSLAAYYITDKVKLLRVCLFISIAFVLSWIDSYYFLLPTKIISLGALLGLAVYLSEAWHRHSLDLLLQAIFGGLVGYGLLMIIYYLVWWIYKKEGIGYGDVRYLGLIGLFTSAQLVGIAFFIGVLCATCYGSICYFLKIHKDFIPLGPFLSAGGIITLLWGEKLLSFYLNFY